MIQVEATVKLTIKGVTVKLTMTEARELAAKLHGIIGETYIRETLPGFEGWWQRQPTYAQPPTGGTLTTSATTWLHIDGSQLPQTDQPSCYEVTVE